MTVSQNVSSVISSVAAAAEASGRSPKDVSIIAATKMNDASRVQEAIAAGIEVCGENRVQEMLEKLEQKAYEGARLHFIGHLQKNKVRNVVGAVELIHSIDSLALLQAVSSRAESLGIVQDVLLEVNIASEASKSGFAPSELFSVLDSAQSLAGVHIRGLMAIPPAAPSGDENSLFFAQMQQLFVDIGAKKYDNSNMDFLSMGMSNDFISAIEHGSNMVRIGTAIFGPRNYGPAI